MLATQIIRLEEGLISISKKRNFGFLDEKRFVTLRLSTRGIRIIDKKGISRVVKELKQKGVKI